MNLVPVLLATMLTGCGWNTTDRVLAASLVACEAVDIAQTAWVIDRGGHELNPLYGSHPATRELVSVKISGLALAGWMLRRAGSRRRLALQLDNGMCGAGVFYTAAGR